MRQWIWSWFGYPTSAQTEARTQAARVLQRALRRHARRQRAARTLQRALPLHVPRLALRRSFEFWSDERARVKVESEARALFYGVLALRKGSVAPSGVLPRRGSLGDRRLGERGRQLSVSGGAGHERHGCVFNSLLRHFGLGE